MIFNKPKVMGILNITPDSFYEGSRKRVLHEVLKYAEKMLADGADILDVGGYSSRPGADDIAPEEELERVLEPIENIRKEFPDSIISIDTFRSDVARMCVSAGANLINDISGGDLDAAMFETVAQLRVPYILMHMRGTPQNMLSKDQYQDVTAEVIRDLSLKVEKASEAGINDIIVDPGFGFAKNIQQNFQLLNRLELLQVLKRPLLIGLSRKSLIYKSLSGMPSDALNGTTVLNTVALLKGASILRVHDVAEAVEAVKLIELLRN